MIFVEEAVEAVDSSDRTRRVGGWCLWGGGVEVGATMEPGGVVVLDVERQDLLGVAPVPDQGPVQALGADGAHPAFGEGVRARLSG